MKGFARKLTLVPILTIAITTGCTEERKYDQVYKPNTGIDKVMEKTVIDANVDYLYVVSTVDTPRKSTATRPHWMADAKRVRLKFGETALKVIQPEEDGRFTDNPTNAHSVLSIPVKHVDYRCQEDSYGKCTNKEEKNNEISWEQKTKFTLDITGMAEQQVAMLPIKIRNLFQGCYKEVGAEVVSSEIAPDGINIQVDKTFQKSGPCAYSIFTLEEATFTVRYHYSLVKMSQLATKGYKTVKYSRADEGNFGFFPTMHHQLDVDNNDIEASETHVFDRWDPNTTVTYHLNETFNKPQFASLKKATYQAVSTINHALKSANTKLRLKLKEPVAGIQSGDLRHNMIVAVDDPQATGVIGYGPHASNPLTGEIVHARTVMYVGTLTKYVKYTYDDFVKSKKAQELSSNANILNITLAPELQVQKQTSNAPSKEEKKSSESNAVVNKLNLDIVRKDINTTGLSKAATSIEEQFVKTESLREMMEELSNSQQYPAEMVNFHGLLEVGIEELITELGLKAWVSLSSAEKQKVVDKLLPYAYLPTLIHELGHNLGLRHNFAASEDKSNFYTVQEVEDLKAGVPTTKESCLDPVKSQPSKYHFSSVMDYSYRSSSELPTLGKYDIAALRYGYAQEVELEPETKCSQGKVISVTQLQAQPDAKIRGYQYCTDEHVSANPNCNRFDAGTNLKEITENYIQAYKERYEIANRRNGRRSFSLYNDASQIGALLRTFKGLRNVFERFESIKNRFDLPANSPTWEAVDFLKDIKDSTIIAGKFFMDVLKTPDTLCAISTVANPGQILAIVPIRKFSKSAISCFDTRNVKLKPAYMVIAEGGKSFQSRKSPYSSNPYMDQIDLRGVWMDKLLASRFLLQRELGQPLFDKYTENFLSIPELRDDIVKTYGEILEDKYLGPVEFNIINGQKVSLTINYNTYDVADANNSHKLITPLSKRVRKYMRLPEHVTSFQKVVLKNIAKDIYSSTSHALESDLFMSLFQVVTELPNNGLSSSNYVSAQVGSQIYFALKQSVFASQAITNFNTVTLLDSIGGPKKVAELVALMSTDVKDVSEPETEQDPAKNEAKAEQPPAEPSQAELEAMALGQEILERYLQGGFQKMEYYAMIIEALTESSEI